MSAQTEFAESWHRLNQPDLAAILHCCDRLTAHAPVLCNLLQQMVQDECEHRDSLRVLTAIPLDDFSLRDIAQAYHGALGLRTALIHSNTAYEWADLLMQAVSTEMCGRCMSADLAARSMLAQEN